MLYFIFIFVILCVAFFVPIEGQRRKTLLIFVFGFGALLMGLRASEVGIDTKNYTLYTKAIIAGNTWFTSPVRNTLEPLYVFFCKLLTTVIPSPHFVLLVFSCVIMSAFGTFIYRYSEDVVLSSVVFFSSFYFAAFNIMRQYLAVAFILYAVMLLDKKCKALGSLLFIVACLTHYSSIIFFPFLILLFLTKKASKKKLVTISIACVVGLMLISYFLEMFVRLFPQYARFLSSERFMSSTDRSLIAILWWCFIIIVIAPCILRKRNNEDEILIDGDTMTDRDTMIDEDAMIDEDTMIDGDTMTRKLAVITIAEFVAWIFSSQIMIASRIVTVFGFARIISLPNCLVYLDMNTYWRIIIKQDYVIIRFAVLVYYMILTEKYLTGNTHGIFPYSFFWS